VSVLRSQPDPWLRQLFPGTSAVREVLKTWQPVLAQSDTFSLPPKSYKRQNMLLYTEKRTKFNVYVEVAQRFSVLSKFMPAAVKG